jgi:GntR family transcriptional regulator
MFILQPQSAVPIYRQIIDQVHRLVASGQLAPGDELPSVREVAQQHTVHPMTISKAYSQLEAEGLLQRNRGKPMTVGALRKGVTATTARLKQIESQIDALVFSARQLELEESEVNALLRARWEQVK